MQTPKLFIAKVTDNSSDAIFWKTHVFDATQIALTERWARSELKQYYACECDTNENEINVEFTDEIDTYYSDDFRDTFLEVHDEHVAWSWENDKISYDEYNLIMEGWLNKMKEDVWCEIYALWRSGRHICVSMKDYKFYDKAEKWWQENKKDVYAEIA